MAKILYGVTFPEPIMALPRGVQGGIPGDRAWEHLDGWSVTEAGNRILIAREPVDLSAPDVSGVPPAARATHEAHAKGSKTILRMVYSVPITMAVVHYIELEGAKGNLTAPSEPLLALIAERRSAPPPPPPRPAGGYQGPPVTPAYRAGPTPPAPVRPTEPPPSIIVMDDEDEEDGKVATS